jgi:nitrite reductase (NADH) large subunit
MKNTNPIRVVVVGNGMVSHRFVDKLTTLSPRSEFSITVFGEEPHPAYDRVHLTKLFGEYTASELILAGEGWYAERKIELQTGCGIVEISLEKRWVRDESGRRTPFDKLVLATGSAAFVPSIPGLVPSPRMMVYRTIGDVEAIKRAAKEAGRAAVIGGGLLGLEAAKALVDLGIEAHVIEAGTYLMQRQLDETAGKVLTNHITDLGVRVHTNVRTREVIESPIGIHIEFEQAEPIDVDFVVIATGIRPRDELAKMLEIQTAPRGGIVVNEQLETSVEDVYAIGECAAFGGGVIGLIAPGYKMADVLARRFVGESVTYEGTDASTKLKLLGVDVASFGDPFADKQTGRSVVLEDFRSGIYKKLCLTEDGTRLLGGMLVGDATQYNDLLELCRSGETLNGRPESFLITPRAKAGETSHFPSQICSCNAVSRKQITEAIAEGASSLTEIKSCTSAGTGCGGCLPLLSEVLKAELARLGKVSKLKLCDHFPFSRQELFDLVRVYGYRSFEEVLKAQGSGLGCEICKPTIASIIASIYNEPILKHDVLQDTNDRFLANIQKGGLYSVVPRIAGGEITPDQLLVIAQVAKKYDLYTKITGGQRIDLFGAKLHQLPLIWEELVNAGFESGHAYGKALRTVKSCVGTTWCRFGVQDSVGMAIRVENRYKGIRAPHKIKGAVSGCVRECAEAQSKDFGLIATEKGYNIYVCGNGGSHPRHADLLVSDVDPDTAIRYLDRFIAFYIKTADRLTRTSKWLESLNGGIEYLRSVILDDRLGIAAELEAHLAHLISTYECEWANVLRDPEKRKRFSEPSVIVDSPAPTPMTESTVERKRVRNQNVPDLWKKPPVLRHLPIVDLEWVEAGSIDDFPREGGRTVTYGRAKIAIFRLESTDNWYATQAVCPHRGDEVIGRGIVGDLKGEPKVACPLHKKTFSLRTGENLEGENFRLSVFRVEVRNHRVFVELPRKLAEVGFLSECKDDCEHSHAAE